MALSNASASTTDATTAAGSSTTKYVILDVTGDSPSWTAVLMAMEASASESNPFTLLGVIATESPELDRFQELMDELKLSECLQVVSCEEQELYPLESYSLDTAPSTVKQLVMWVDAHPEQVTIYASHALTTVAYAEAADPTFASKVKELMMVSSVSDELDYATKGLTAFYENSPFLADQQAFMNVLGGDIPMMRIIGTLEPVLSGPEIATRVKEQVIAEGGSVQDRPAARTYLAGHMARMFAGHMQAILLQEPGMAVLVQPELIEAEEDVEFTTEDLEGTGEMLKLRKIADEDVDEEDRATLISRISEEEFWELLVHIRSRDWSGFCSKSTEDHLSNRSDKVAHDEL